MRSFLLGLSFALVFVAGLMAFQVMRWAVPTAHAGGIAAESSSRWEYYCQNEIKRPWTQDDLAKLNELGRKGWELVNQLGGYQGANYDVFCFKRPYVAPPSMPAPKRCIPACDSGLQCDDGKCVPNCQPSCGESQYCASDRRCYWIRDGRRTADLVSPDR